MSTGFIGPSFTAEARKLAGRQISKAAWPYWWEYAPANSIPVLEYGGVQLPDSFRRSSPRARIRGAEVVSVCVARGDRERGFRRCRRATPPVYVSVPFAPGLGSVTFTLDVNQDLGNPLVLGAPVKDFAEVTVPLGSWEHGPWPVRGRSGLVFEPDDILRWKVESTIFFTNDFWASCGLHGWLVPCDDAQ